MTFFYLLAGAVVAWLVYKALSKSPLKSDPAATTTRHDSSALKVTYEVGEKKTSDANHDEDEWEGSFWEVTKPVTAHARLRINYLDGIGNKTERTVDVRQFGAYDDTSLLIGHCTLRDAARTFRSDRIQKCIDVQTGELVNDVVAYLQNKYDVSPDRSRDVLLIDEYDTIRLLLYVGKADGQLRAAEKTIIREACITLANDARLSADSIDKLLTEMDVPTLAAFKLAVGRISKRDPTKQFFVLNTAEKMVATQKSVHPSEQEALDYMQKRFAIQSADLA